MPAACSYAHLFTSVRGEGLPASSPLLSFDRAGLSTHGHVVRRRVVARVRVVQLALNVGQKRARSQAEELPGATRAA